MKNRKKRGRIMIISALLCAMMVLSLNPVSALAEGEGIVGAASAVTTEAAGQKDMPQADDGTENTAPQTAGMDGDAQPQEPAAGTKTAEEPGITTAPSETPGDSQSGNTEITEPAGTEETSGAALPGASLPASGCVLVAGLGNTDITPDALGPRTSAHVLATRHLHDALGEEEAFLRSLRPVAVLAGGVLGQTGMESAELIRAAADAIHPAAVIAVDALACTSLSRLGTTIQISDAGIAPGSGVANHRTALDTASFGIPVIGIGVPTVIGMRDLTGRAPLPRTADMMVTPRDIDRLISQAAHLLGCGINLALHPQLDYADVEAFQ